MRFSLIARSDWSKEGSSLCVTLYFYTPPKPLISKLFNHDTSPGLSLSRASRALRCRCRRRSLFSSFPQSSDSPTRTLRPREKFQETCFCRFTTRRILGCAMLPDIFFHSTKKSPPLADIRRRTLIFLARSFSFSLFPANIIIHSLLLSFSPSVHTPTLSLSLWPLFLFFFISLSLFLSLYPWICSFVIVFMLKLPLWVTLSTCILYLTRSPSAAERFIFWLPVFLLRML